MNQFSLLLSYYEKQLNIIEKILIELENIDLSDYKDRFVFAMRAQQLFTCIEDLFKHIAKSFENHIHDLKQFHKELLLRMSLEILDIRPAVISQKSFVILDKLRSFRHFARHAYDCELDENELKILQNRLKKEFEFVIGDLNNFKNYIINVIKS